MRKTSSAKKIKMASQYEPIKNFFDRFIVSCTARGLSEATVRTYRGHLKIFLSYLDTSTPFSELSASDFEKAIVDMRNSGTSHNTIASYMRSVRAFINWGNSEGYCRLTIPSYAPTESVKDTYTDDELKQLIKKPDSKCSFCEYRNWIIVQFLLNCGCRAATIRNIKNKDVDFESKQVVFRHTKAKKVQVIPLSTTMVTNLKKYMSIRQGEPDDYLFCTETGEMLTSDGLAIAIQRYNKSRGVTKTSIHMFRHTFARKYLIDCGGNALTLQKLLGHSTLEMTKHYCNIFDADIAKGFDNISPLEKLTATKERIKK